MPSPTRRRIAALAVTATALLGQLLTGTATAAPAEPPSAIDWQPCESPYGEGTFECGTLTVPADWARPQGPTLDLALARSHAGDPDRRIGSLLVNPGGPGLSGVNMALSAPFAFSSELASRFDFVGFDPRGVGDSAPSKCDGDLLTARRAAFQVQDEAGLTTLREANRAFADSCTELSGPLAEHMDSASVAHDMDAIRRALGEDRISYYGGSYGTLIGQMYAELYPRHIRAMVLDSNMDHSQGAWGVLKARTLELEGAFGQFADWCERTTTCDLYGRDVRAVYATLHKRAEAGTLTLPDPTRVISADLLRSITSGYMYDPAEWSTLSWLLAAMDGTATATSADLTEATQAAGAPVTFAYDPILCQDFDFDVPSYATLAGYRERLAELAPLTRLASLSWSYLTSCQGWTDRVANPQHPLRVHGAPNILVANSRYDVATPHAWASNVTRQIGREATLLTYDGVGHITYWLSPCMQAAIDVYLTTLTTPAKGTHCPAVWPER